MKNSSSFSISRAPLSNDWLFTRQTPHSRKNIRLSAPRARKPGEEAPPVAAESFSLAPEYYHSLLDRVEDLLRDHPSDKPL